MMECITCHIVLYYVILTSEDVQCFFFSNMNIYNAVNKHVS